MEYPFQNKNPVLVDLNADFIKDAGVSLSVLREDQAHLPADGNKWWKLKYNLTDAKSRGSNQLLTFGGAFSNHIYATAAMAKANGLKSIGIIRGEQLPSLNPVLTFALDQGMQLKFVSRDQYRLKTDTQFLASLNAEFGDSYIIPEGGSNFLALKGCQEWGNLLRTLPFDFVCVPCGTGTTAAGIISGIGDQKTVIGFSVLKGNFMRGVIAEALKQIGGQHQNWQVAEDYHFGGYAKSDERLIDFIDDFQRTFKIPIEPVYSGKMMYGVFDCIRQEKFKPGSRILAIHTGGIH